MGDSGRRAHKRRIIANSPYDATLDLVGLTDDALRAGLVGRAVDVSSSSALPDSANGVEKTRFNANGTSSHHGVEYSDRSLDNSASVDGVSRRFPVPESSAHIHRQRPHRRRSHPTVSTSAAPPPENKSRPSLKKRRRTMSDLGEFDTLNAKGELEARLVADERSRIRVNRRTRSFGSVQSPSSRRPAKLRSPIIVRHAQEASAASAGNGACIQNGILSNAPVSAEEKDANEVDEGLASHVRAVTKEIIEDEQMHTLHGPAAATCRALRRSRRGRASLFKMDVIDLTHLESSSEEKKSATSNRSNSSEPPLLPHVYGDLPNHKEYVLLPDPRTRRLIAREIDLVSKLTMGGKPDEKLSTIPSARITLRRRDFRLLRGTRWLNDEVINCYMALINDREERYWTPVDAGERQREPGRPRVYCFNTFFYTRLTSDKGGYDFQGVARWTKRAQVDILKLDILLVPVNLGNSHWVLSAIDMPRKDLYFLDSMHGRDKTRVVPTLRRWVEDEIRDKHGVGCVKQFSSDQWKVYHNKYRIRCDASKKSDATVDRHAVVPRQRDHGSCGVYTSKMADCLALGTKMYFSHDTISLMRSRMALHLYSRVLPG